MLRVTPDTNVLISAFITEGNEYAVLDLAREGKIKLIISEAILEEFNEVIQREKFGFSQEQIVDFNTQLSAISEIVEPREKISAVKSDPDDDKILEAAVEGKVDYLISGDKHLLDLEKFRGINVVNARTFLNKIRSNS